MAESFGELAILVGGVLDGVSCLFHSVRSLIFRAFFAASNEAQASEDEAGKSEFSQCLYFHDIILFIYEHCFVSSYFILANNVTIESPNCTR